MATTFAQIITQLRTRLGETNPSEWSDPQLLRYSTTAEVWLARNLAKIRNSGRFQYQENLPLTSGSTTIAWSSLTKRFDVVRKIEQLMPSGYWSCPLPEIPEMQENLWTGYTPSQYSSETISGYLVREPNFVILPSALGDRTLRFTYNWLPATGKDTSSTLDTPVDYDDLLVCRALHFALADVGEANKQFEDEYSGRIAELEEIEVMRSHGGGGERVVMTSTGLW